MAGTITSFTSQPQSNLYIDGNPYNVQTAGESYSLTEPDSQTLRFEIHAGDPAWFDGSTIDRSEVQMNNLIAVGMPTNISYQFMVEPGATNTAPWLVTAELHSNDGDLGVSTSPPFAIEMQGEHMAVVARYGNPATGSVTTRTLWTDPNPIVRGQYYNIQIQTSVANNSSGFLDVYINGNQVVNYNGPLGYGSRTYWEEGLYRHTSPEVMAADFRNLTITTGSLPAPTTPTTPTIQPAVTQATATPGTGIEHAGDVITLTLAFNEAVTVTGTPTLSLNDGGKATYVSGSGSGTLTFKTTVASTDTSTSALAITGVNLPSGTAIKDASGNAANLSGAVKTFTGLQIDPILPAVTQATAVPGTGTEHVGDTITLTLAFNEAVTVTGTPTLSLNDGGKATYFGGSGTGTLTFKTTVASTDTSTSALAITGVNLPSGTAIKDASGVAANLSAAVKTFSGLAVSTASTTPTDPTAPTTPTPPTPSATKPVLTVADHSLWVAGRGGSVDLGTTVTTTDSNDVVTLNITGLPKYETITDKLDGQTFRGNNITLTAAQVDSGLVLHSYYRGGGHPTATLTLTASAKDPTTGTVATASPQSITVVDPRPTTTTTTTTSSHHHHHTATNQQPVATTTAAAPTTSHTTESTDHQHTAAASTGSLASQGFARLQQHFDPAASTLATTAAHPIMAADHPAATGTTMASFASQSFALLNQYLAAHTGRVDPGQFVTALSQATGWGHDSLLARPQH
ncbi:hypothetical protein ABIE89_003858 [Bradyrhizobium niftali]|uniref:heparin lyase I family protein n=1 Tax=Bradyrhizobium niftali TaxID=2560055 RepID=UPI0038342700